MMLGCHIRPITHLETGKWVKTRPKQWGKMCWALLCPIQVLFQIQVGSKKGYFWGLKQPKWQDAILSKKINPKNTHFWTNLDHGIALGWGIKVSNTSFPIAWGVFWPIFQFPDGLLVWYGSLASWSILTLKRAFLDAPWPGMGPGEELNDLKPPYHIYKQVTGAFRV